MSHNSETWCDDLYLRKMDLNRYNSHLIVTHSSSEPLLDLEEVLMGVGGESSVVVEWDDKNFRPEGRVTPQILWWGCTTLFSNS